PGGAAVPGFPPSAPLAARTGPSGPDGRTRPPPAQDHPHPTYAGATGWYAAPRPGPGGWAPRPSPTQPPTGWRPGGPSTPSWPPPPTPADPAHRGAARSTAAGAG